MKPKDLILRAVNPLHRGLVRLSRGRVLGSVSGLPIVVLTTVGARSGKRRQTVLMAPLVDGDTVVLVASYGGDDRDPAWLHNLRAEPRVELEMKGRSREMTAREATEAEKAELWPRVVEAWKGYGRYQTMTSRDIPLVLLEP